MLALGLVLLLQAAAAAPETPDVAAARALFQRNLDAIAHRDRAAYLACYLNAPTLARTGPEGVALGYAGLEKDAGDAWPDTFEALDLRLVPVREGVVYGTYRYRVRYGAEEHSGLSERTFLRTPAGWRIAVSTAFDAPPGTPPPPRALVGATLVDGTGASAVSDAVVIVRDGKIACAGARGACSVPANVEVVDLRGRWITPGLIDAHVHFSQTGWADGRPDAFDVRKAYPYEDVQASLEAHPEPFFRSYLCSGVTSVFDVGGYPWTVSGARRHAQDLAAPRWSSAGPLLSTFEPGRLGLSAAKQFIVMKDEETTRTAVRYVKSLGAAAVKVWYIPRPDRPVEAIAPLVLAAGDEARGVQLPLIVHATGLAEAKVALRAGARLLVHSVDDQAVDQEFLDLAKKAGTIYTPTLTVLDGYRRMFAAAAERQAPLVDDPNSCVDAATRARVASSAGNPWNGELQTAATLRARADGAGPIMAANLKRIFDAGVPIATGTDAGNPLTLHGPSVYAEMEAMVAAGLTSAQVIVASTRGGSLALGRDAEVGTLEKGKIADLLVLTADPLANIANVRRVDQVMRGGVLRSVGELKAIVAAGPTQVASQPERAIIAYVFARDGVIDSSAIDARKLTHINYAFANIKDGRVVEGFARDPENYAALRALREREPHLKLLVSVGGWTWSGGFSDAALTARSRKRFVASAVDFVRERELDGFDVDWEYPGLPGFGNVHRPEDKENFTALMSELRAAFETLGRQAGRRYWLTFAAGAGSDFLEHTEMDKVQAVVDYVNLMTYDFRVAGGGSVAGHHANLYANPADPDRLSVDRAVTEFLAAGVPAAKLVVGVPFYGRAWANVTPVNDGLYQAGTEPKERLETSYDRLAAELVNHAGFVRRWDAAARAPYLWNEERRLFIGYDDPESLAAKCRYIRERGLGGAMFWEYFSDRSGALLGALHDGLRP